MSERMANAPVYFALAQIKFTPIAAMAKYVPDIQDYLRTKGFPEFESHSSNQLLFEQNAPNEPPKPIFQEFTQWHFISEDRDTNFILGNDHITLQTTNYDTHEPFLEHLLTGLDCVRSITKPAYATRMGIRYFDAVMPQTGESLNDYFVEQLQSVELDLQPIHSIEEAIYNTVVGPAIKNGTLITKIRKVEGLIGFSPDVIPFGLTIQPKFAEFQAGWHAVIDSDHFVDGKIDLDDKIITQQFLSMHKVIKDSFEKMVSPHALKCWGKSKGDL
ncbi:TPA: TIGR04255 family protein [Klebsiella variicola]|uniref:TIGR04255 family protein n=1 Tax=Klebsiella pneumoniae complex TaxID=3390273 RepID=UPI00073C7D12|nr:MULTISPECIES: TIGR04255 family protein [Klebsiella]HCI6216188.1 TIGR04255 family protein [Klebsiella quasipneumoniae subsp. quasipneumoniae]KSZ22144.1 hypothetical protein APU20_09795 [Klebsiella variicola]MCM5825195.1 TIGR04255 family protein [Klebsiella pneumoniae]MCS5964756.1 TIGR04255 family protein [Klebsiella variicola subsp. variicola]MCU8684479.1 TIGR04255 family protein [Klebsiella pneumoniae]